MVGLNGVYWFLFLSGIGYILQILRSQTGGPDCKVSEFLKGVSWGAQTGSTFSSLGDLERCKRGRKRDDRFYSIMEFTGLTVPPIGEIGWSNLNRTNWIVHQRHEVCPFISFGNILSSYWTGCRIALTI